MSLSLYLVGGKWLIGPTTLHKNGQASVSPVYEYVGGITPTDRPGGLSVRHGVIPLNGLMSLKSARIRFDAVVDLTELDDSERKDIERAFAQCEDMVAAVRAEMAGVASGPIQPRIIVPGGVRV